MGWGFKFGQVKGSVDKRIDKSVEVEGCAHWWIEVEGCVHWWIEVEGRVHWWIELEVNVEASRGVSTWWI